jgi:hypothetical protein
MVVIVEQTRADQERAGTRLRACKVSAQLKIIDTCVPELQEALDKLEGAIIRSTTAQFALVTTEIPSTTGKLMDKMDVDFKGGLDTARHSDSQNSGLHSTTHEFLGQNKALLQELLQQRTTRSLEPAVPSFTAAELRPIFYDLLQEIHGQQKTSPLVPSAHSASNGIGLLANGHLLASSAPATVPDFFSDFGDDVNDGKWASTSGVVPRNTSVCKHCPLQERHLF